jgi:hypothetical protein
MGDFLLVRRDPTKWWKILIGKLKNFNYSLVVIKRKNREGECIE